MHNSLRTLPLVEIYPSLWEMNPLHKKYPVTWIDGWLLFRHLPLGTLAPDATLVMRSNEPQISWKTLLEDNRLLVLFFDGSAHGDSTKDTIQKAESIADRYHDLLNVRVVTYYYHNATYDPVQMVMGDMDGRCHRAFGARGQSIVVLRPDGVVIWKSCGFMMDALELYLNDAKNIAIVS